MKTPYSPKVMDHFTRPRNVGSLDGRSARVGTGVAGKPDCGDVIRMQIEVDGEGRIVNAKFKTFGCGAAIAASSFTTEWLKGQTVEGIGELRNTTIAEELSLPPAKVHCSILAEDAAKAAVADWRRKHDRRNENGRPPCPSL